MTHTKNFGDENNVFVHHSSIGRFGGVLQRLTSFITNVHTHTHTHIYIYTRVIAQAGNNEFDLALADAEKVIELKPDFVKGYGRKGAALFGKG